MTELESYRQWMHPAHKHFGAKPLAVDRAINEAIYRDGGTGGRDNPDHVFNPDEWCLDCNPSRDAEHEPLTATVPTEYWTPKPVMYSRYCSTCHTVFDSFDPFDRVYCEGCKAPEPMTLARAVEVLNEHKWDGCTNWVASENSINGAFAIPADSDSPRKDMVEPFVAIAIAEKLLRES